VIYVCNKTLEGDVVMRIKYELNGLKRKKMAEIIAENTGDKVEYLGTPTYGYKVGNVMISKEAEVDFGEFKCLKEMHEILIRAGFTSEEVIEEEPGSGLSIEFPAYTFEEKDILNLKALLAAKGNLIRKALNASNTDLKVEYGKLILPWFNELPEPEEISAITVFIDKLINLAKIATRISSKEKEVENEKYAFRCFLLRLGLIGDDFKECRKILLKNLTGSSAFKNGGPKNETSK